MTVKFNEIDEIVNEMTIDQLKAAMLTMAIAIKNREVIDKIDYVEAVKMGLSWPSK